MYKRRYAKIHGSVWDGRITFSLNIFIRWCHQSNFYFDYRKTRDFLLWNKGYSCIKFSVRNRVAGTYETKKANSSRSLWKALHSRWHHIRSQCSQIFAKKIIFYSLFKEDFCLILVSDADWVDKKNQIFGWFCFCFGLVETLTQYSISSWSERLRLLRLALVPPPDCWPLLANINRFCRCV